MSSLSVNRYCIKSWFRRIMKIVMPRQLWQLCWDRRTVAAVTTTYFPSQPGKQRPTVHSSVCRLLSVLQKYFIPFSRLGTSEKSQCIREQPKQRRRSKVFYGHCQHRLVAGLFCFISIAIPTSLFTLNHRLVNQNFDCPWSVLYRHIWFLNRFIPRVLALRSTLNDFGGLYYFSCWAENGPSWSRDFAPISHAHQHRLLNTVNWRMAM